MKKKVLVVLCGLAVLVVGGGVGGHAWLKGKLQKESLVAQMEEAWNLRAQLDDTTVSLFSMPATVKLIGLKLAPSDAEVEKPLVNRTPLAPEKALVSANEVELSIELTDLLKGTVNVEKLHIEGLSVRNVVQDGNGILNAMFRPRGFVEGPGREPASTGGTGGGAVPGETQLAAVDPTAPVDPQAPIDTKRAKPKKEHKPARPPMMASQLKVNLAVKNALISKCHLEHTDLTGKTKATIEHLEIASDIDVAPHDLANHNLAKFNLSAALRFEKTDEQLVMADCLVEGGGTIKPFDPKSGELMPSVDLAVTIRKGGLLGGILIEKQMKKKDLEDLAKKGIHLGDIAMGGVLTQDASTRLHVMPSGKMIIKQKTLCAFPQYEISVDEQSWIAPAQDNHNVKALLVVSPELSAKMIEEAKKTFAEQQNAENATAFEAFTAAMKGLATDWISAGLMDEKKRLMVPYRSKGKLSKPSIDIEAMATDAVKSGDILNKVLNELFPTKDDKKEEPGKQESDRPDEVQGKK